MRNVLINVLLLLTVSVSGQGLIATTMVTPTPAASDEWLYEDDYDLYSTGTLDGKGDWVETAGSDFTIADAGGGDNVVSPSTATTEILAYYNQSIDDDMWVQVSYEGAQSGRGLGPATNIQSATGYGYGFYSTTTATYLMRRSSAGDTELASGTAVSPTAILGLKSHGDTLICYVDGAIYTGISGDGKVTDDGIYKQTGGYAGVWGYGSSVDVIIDEWKAKNVE